MKIQQLIRLKFIQAMLSVYGAVSKEVLVRVLEVAPATVTKDFEEYRRYDPSFRYDGEYYRNDRRLTPEWWAVSPGEFLAAIQVVYHTDFGRDFIRMGFKNAKTS